MVEFVCCENFNENFYSKRRFKSEIEKDYKNMSEMIYGDYPSFEEMIKVLQELEKEINK